MYNREIWKLRGAINQKKKFRGENEYLAINFLVCLFWLFKKKKKVKGESHAFQPFNLLSKTPLSYLQALSLNILIKSKIDFY